MGEGDAVCVDFWADVCGVFYCGVYAEVEVLKARREKRRGVKGSGRRGALGWIWVACIMCIDSGMC